MERLTDEIKFHLDTFKRCQLCGYVGTYPGGDICEFRMHQECDDEDKTEENNYLVICAKGMCAKKLFDHPRLYVEVPWGQGKPGCFMLVCGDCSFREGTNCRHPDLKSNGGNGLEVHQNPMGADVHVSFANGTGGWLKSNRPISKCYGRKDKQGLGDG